MAEMVGLAQLASRLKLDISSVRRLIARDAEHLQLQVHRGKQDRIMLSREDADRLVASYEARRGPIADSEGDATKYDRFGYFYVIQLIPEYSPNRIKIGFADNAEKRLAEHRTAAPTARLVKTWPCKRSWDYAAMDSITREGCKLVLNEVFEGDVEGFVKRADSFFSVMPNPDSERELSEHSPLFGGNETET